MRIAIALLKLNFASWLRTNVRKKRAFVNRVVHKSRTTVTVFSYFCEWLVLCKQYGFRNRKNY